MDARRNQTNGKPDGVCLDCSYGDQNQTQGQTGSERESRQRKPGSGEEKRLMDQQNQTNQTRRNQTKNCRFAETSYLCGFATKPDKVSGNQQDRSRKVALKGQHRETRHVWNCQTRQRLSLFRERGVSLSDIGKRDKDAKNKNRLHSDLFFGYHRSIIPGGVSKYGRKTRGS